MSTATIDVINKGIQCLTENMGQMECEIFIATILRERFDYTEWRRTIVDQVNSFEELGKLKEEVNSNILQNRTAHVVI